MTQPAEGTHAVDVSVLIPVLNEERHIRETVAAMREQRFDGELEFLFMDGRSEDRTRAILEELSAEDPRIRVFENPERTTPHGLNVGLANARGEFVARMDAHTFYPPTYLARGVERLREGGVDWVAGPQVPRGEGRWSKRVAMALESPLATIGSRRFGSEGGGSGEIELDTGVFTGVWRRETVQRFGGWAPGWPINQDSELAARMLAEGLRIVQLPELAAGYVPRDSLKKLARQYFRYGMYRAKTARYHPASMRRSHLMAPGMVLCVLGSVAAPTRPLRALARLGFGAYLGVIVIASARNLSEGAAARDVASLPAVFLTMHLAWGSGYVVSSFRWGPPLAAVARAAGLSR